MACVIVRPYDDDMAISRRLVRRLASSLLLAVAISGPGTVSGREQAIQPPELAFVAPPELEPVAASLRRLETERLVSVMRLLGLTDAGPPITVMLAPEDSPVARRTASWVAGFANGDAGLIVILPARTPSYPYDSMEAVLHHEVTHVLVSRAAPGADIPRWFHEGLAMILEHTWSLRERSELALAVVGGRPSLATLEADFHGSATTAARAYGVAGAFVRDLIRRHGPGFPARLLASLAAGAQFDDAFKAATYESLAEAERLFWRESWWYRVVPLVTSSIAIWMVILLLAVSARRRRVARQRALRERWEAEDRALSVAVPDAGPSMLAETSSDRGGAW